MELTSSIVDTLVSSKTLPYSLALLEASFCHAIPGLHDQDLQSVPAKLTTYVEETEAQYYVGPVYASLLDFRDIWLLDFRDIWTRTIRAKCYCPTDSFGRKFLMNALKPMVGCTRELLWADNVVHSTDKICWREELFLQ
jgi:hypothetical protein